MFIRKIVESANCALCGQAEETIEHLLWDCTISNTFWGDLLTLLKNRCHGCQNLRLTKKLIIFGVEIDVVTDEIIDLIVVLAKYHIYSCKWNNGSPNVDAFLKILKHRHLVEQYANALKYKLTYFNQIWLPYMGLLN